MPNSFIHLKNVRLFFDLQLVTFKINQRLKKPTSIDIGYLITMSNSNEVFLELCFCVSKSDCNTDLF